mgnify:CR=1 FL=1
MHVMFLTICQYQYDRKARTMGSYFEMHTFLLRISAVSGFNSVLFWQGSGDLNQCLNFVFCEKERGINRQSSLNISHLHKINFIDINMNFPGYDFYIVWMITILYILKEFFSYLKTNQDFFVVAFLWTMPFDCLQWLGIIF